jgi:hypothetical protein
MLDSWSRPPWLNSSWIVVRFNHCGVKWPRRRTSHERRELIVQSAFCCHAAQGETCYHGGEEAQQCANHLDHEIHERDLLSFGNAEDCGGPIGSCDVPWMSVKGSDGRVLSSGGGTTLALSKLFPSVPIVCAGFDQEQSPGANARAVHAWDYEAELLEQLEKHGLVRVVNTEHEMRHAVPS